MEAIVGTRESEGKRKEKIIGGKGEKGENVGKNTRIFG